MADKTATQSGDWNNAATWGGSVPTTDETVDTSQYTVTIPAGHATAEVGDTHVGSGGVLYVKGTLNIAGQVKLDDVDTVQTLRMDGGGIIEFICSSNGQGGRGVKALYSGTQIFISASNPVDSPAIIRGRSSDLRPHTLLETGIVRICDINGLKLYNGYQYGWLFAGIYDEGGSYSRVKNVVIHTITTDGTGGTGIAVVGGSHSVVSDEMRNICIYNCDGAINVAYEMICHNVVLGRDIDGNAYPNSRFDIYASYQSFKYENIVYDTFELRDFAYLNIDIRNKDYIVQDGIFASYPVTGMVPGTNEFHQSNGVAQIGSTAVITPDADCVSTKPFVLNDDHSFSMNAKIPVSGGDAVSISASVTLNASQPANSVKLYIDPRNTYGLRANSTETTPQDDTTTLTVSGTIPSGSFTGFLDWRIEVNNYGAGGTVTVNSVLVTVGDRRYSLDMASWDFDHSRTTGSADMTYAEMTDYLGMAVNEVNQALPDPYTFNDNLLAKCLNKGQTKALMRISRSFLIDLDVTVTGKALDGNGAFNLSTLSNPVFQDTLGIDQIQITGGKFCRIMTFDEYRRLCDMDMTPSANDPICYFRGTSVYVSPYSGNTIDIYYMREPSTIASGANCELSEGAQNVLLEYAAERLYRMGNRGDRAKEHEDQGDRLVDELNGYMIPTDTVRYRMYERKGMDVNAILEALKR